MFKTRKASIELSVNFIVIMILSVVLLGMGVFLIRKGESLSSSEYEKVDLMHQKQIAIAMASSDEKTMVYPASARLQRGESAYFTVGINNNNGTRKSFYIHAAAANPSSEWNVRQILFTRSPVQIENGEAGYTPIRATAPKAGVADTYIVNICVSELQTLDNCPPTNRDDMYGDLQKVFLYMK